ncbi:MAG: hypothetical protein R3C15_01215 [Thermoleophilia bacterium]
MKGLRSGKKWLVLGGAALALAATPMAVVAASSQGGSGLDQQNFVLTTTSASTSSTAWANVPGLRDHAVCARDGVSATVSLVLTGAPADVRVRLNDATTVKPGSVRFDPGSGTTGFSFTFVQPVSNGIQSFDVQWRSPTGGAVTLARGDLNVLFEDGTCG